MTVNSQIHSKSTTKIGSQQVFNNFYLTVPSATQQGMPIINTETLSSMVSQAQKGFSVSMPLAACMPTFTQPTVNKSLCSEDAKSVKGVSV